MKNKVRKMKLKNFVENKVKSLSEEINEYYTTLGEIAKGNLNIIEEINDFIKELRQKEARIGCFMNRQSKQQLKQSASNILCIKYYFEVVFPLYNVMYYIEMYRNPKEVIDELKELNLSFNERISMEDFFYVLVSLPKKVSGIIIDSISCGTYHKETLYQYFLANDKENFINFILKEKLDITNVLNVCFIHREKVISESLGSDYWNDEEDSLLDELFFHSPILNKLKEEPTAFGGFWCDLVKNGRVNMEMLQLDLKETIQKYQEEKEWYTPKEQRIIEEIIKKTDCIDIYNLASSENSNKLKMGGLDMLPNIIDRDCPKEQIQKLELPDDYFELPSNEDDCISVDHIHPLVKKRGVTVFKDFIEYVAEQGYIENNLETKASFAYRLTGILRPDNLLERIEWKKDRDRNSRCLYYLVKNFYTGNGRKDIGSSAFPNSKYERMKRFFICKTDIPNPSSYAIGSSAFRKKLREFFSDKFEEKT